MRTACVALLLCAFSIPGLAQITVLTSFDKTNGRDPGYPAAPFVQGTNGKLYGTTAAGGTNDEGTVFAMTTAGELNTLYSFCSQAGCSDGAVANAGLMQATDDNLYGTTDAGGNNNSGTVFRITPAGTLTTLYPFCSVPGCPDGANPSAGLVQGADGALYGTTSVGGAYGYGTIFKVTTAGSLTTIASFDRANGANPGFGSLVEGVNGNFYGTTISGGANSGCGGDSGCGTVFSVTPTGQLTTIYSFCAQPNCADGTEPFGGVVPGNFGELYGVTTEGGANNYGTVFKLTTAGALKTLRSFDFTDGAYPEAALIEGTDGNFYGTTSNGGAHGAGGTLFDITPHGELTTLYSFCSEAGCGDGNGPFESLMQATNGEFYGTTFAGGTSSNCSGGCGTTFSLETGLAAFVETRPSSGKVGSRVIVLGNSLIGATAVSFNGTAASFRVVSSTEIAATVPAGATDGPLTVTVPGAGTLESNQIFYVKP